MGSCTRRSLKSNIYLYLFTEPLLYVLYFVRIYGGYMIRQAVALKAYVKISMNINQNKEYKLHENRNFGLF